MTGQQTPSPGWREAAARIIDPVAMCEIAGKPRRDDRSERRKAALAKADQIAALPRGADDAV